MSEVSELMRIRDVLNEMIGLYKAKKNEFDNTVYNYCCKGKNILIRTVSGKEIILNPDDHLILGVQSIKINDTCICRDAIESYTILNE